ncbi:hypothetical protein L218DRAFT_943043 [Marasmius fiardii PR-910]|nr:hypothetical protein L218DRAFT_943043 [Marasmius fiardii PR-910]
MGSSSILENLHISSSQALGCWVINNAGGILSPTAAHRPVDLLILDADKEDQAGMVREGKNMWPNVDIDELTGLYDLLLDSILKSPTTTPHGREGIFFAHSDESELCDLSRRIAEVLFKLGNSATDEPSTFAENELEPFKIARHLGDNIRCKSSNATRLGWRPVKTTKDFLDSMDAEVTHQLAVRSSGQSVATA